MFTHITRYDWLMLKSNRTLLLSFLLLLFFVAFALWNGAAHVHFQEQTAQAIQQKEADDYSKVTENVKNIEQGIPYVGQYWLNPTKPFVVGYRNGNRYAILPNAPLSLISFGQSDLMPYYHQVTILSKQALYHGEEIENPSILYNGNFDLSFVIVFLLPLLIMALTYNIVSSEKEQGTLALLLSANTNFRRIVLDKYIFRFLLLNAAFVIMVAVGLLVAGVDLAHTAGSLLYLLLITLLYTAFWFGLSFLVNSYGKNSGYNAAVLVGCWLVFALLIPALLNVSATTLHPLPSRMLQITKSREVSDEVAKAGSKKLDQYYNDHPELLPKGKKVDYNDYSLAYMQTQIEVDKAIQPIENQFTEQRKKQQQFISYYRFFSPAIFTQQALNSVAGTGQDRYTDYENQVDTFYADFQEYFRQKVFRQEKMKSTDFTEIPSFKYEAPELGLFSLSNGLNLLVLGALSGLFVFWGLRRVSRVGLAFT